MQMQECGCDVQVWAALVDWKMVDILPGMMREVQDSDCREGHSLIFGVSFGDGTQVRQPNHVRTVHCDVHILFRKALRTLIPFGKGEPFKFDQQVVSADAALQLGTLLRACTVLSQCCYLSAEVTLSQTSLFGELDMLEVQLHQGKEGGVRRKPTG